MYVYNVTVAFVDISSTLHTTAKQQSTTTSTDKPLWWSHAASSADQWILAANTQPYTVQTMNTDSSHHRLSLINL